MDWVVRFVIAVLTAVEFHCRLQESGVRALTQLNMESGIFFIRASFGHPVLYVQ